MKTLVIGTMLLGVALGFTSCDEDDPLPVERTATTQLSQDEINSLLFVREEEKVARDVYTTLYEKWNIVIFANISSSEQSHMDAVLALLDKYDIPDPVGDNGVGVFKNTELQVLYNDLVTQGSDSILDALIVGATIEDLDLFDLKEKLTTIEHDDLALVFNSLLKGSRNHLRAFYSSILLAGGTYIPQYITQEEFDAVVNSPIEKGH